MLQNAQLWQLGKDVAQLQSAAQTVLNVSLAGATLSGLGLVTSITGFAFLHHRMKTVDTKLAALEQGVKGIKNLLAGSQRSKLKFAIGNLRHAESASNTTLTHDLLLQSKREFGTLTHHCKDQWTRCRTVREIEAVNELYTLAILGHATVCSNLGLGADAGRDLRVHCNDWTRQARQHTKTLLFADRPDRLLAGEYVDVLRAKSLIGLLDFAHDARRGINWLDNLRLGQSRHRSVFENITASAPVGLQCMPGKNDAAEFATMAHSLCARAEVMDANVEHFDFLHAKHLTAIGFQKLLSDERQMLGAEAICVSAVAHG